MDKEFNVTDVFEECVLVSYTRIDKKAIQAQFSDVPLYFYDMRGSDDDPEMPCVIENKPVWVNFVGTLISLKPLLDCTEEYKLIGDMDLHFSGENWDLQKFVRGQIVGSMPITFNR